MFDFESTSRYVPICLHKSQHSSGDLEVLLLLLASSMQIIGFASQAEMRSPSCCSLFLSMPLPRRRVMSVMRTYNAFLSQVSSVISS